MPSFTAVAWHLHVFNKQYNIHEYFCKQVLSHVFKNIFVFLNLLLMLNTFSSISAEIYIMYISVFSKLFHEYSTAEKKYLKQNDATHVLYVCISIDYVNV